MFLAAAALVLVLTVPLLGGDLRRLAAIRLRSVPLLYAMLAVQVVLTEVPHIASHAVGGVVHVATYVGIAVFAWHNRAIPGVVVIALGGMLNGITIALNGGTLPASASALRAAHVHLRPSDFANSGLVAHPRLARLGDTMATPPWLPLRNVMSIGDLVILAGVVILLHVAGRSLPVRALAAGPVSGPRRASEAAAPA